ncbi:MAG: hypothetical protein H6Q84_2308 [Deltaproteobacteria bacterium]|nr:hypothetical protein [Deltaproteobacteria bacterium]
MWNRILWTFFALTILAEVSYATQEAPPRGSHPRKRLRKNRRPVEVRSDEDGPGLPAATGSDDQFQSRELLFHAGKRREEDPVPAATPPENAGSAAGGNQIKGPGEFTGAWNSYGSQSVTDSEPAPRSSDRRSGSGSSILPRLAKMVSRGLPIANKWSKSPSGPRGRLKMAAWAP